MTEYLFGISDTGKVRDNNEDLFITQSIMNGKYLIAGVIDGVGGYNGGEIAAALTRDIVLDELSVIGNNIVAQLEIAFNLANEEILAKKLVSNDFAKMACVATVVVIDRMNNELHYIHVGDTRLYLFRDKSLVKLSHDQSFVGFLEDSGRITEEAAMNHPKRNQINQALGLASIMGAAEPYFETGSSPFLPSDLILLCSDGLTDLVDKTGITTILNQHSTLQEKAEKLVELANQAGGKDNVTVVLAENDSKPVSHEVKRPVTEARNSFRNAAAPVAPASPSPYQVNHGVVAVGPKKNNRLVFVLSALCVLFALISLLLYLQRSPEPAKPETPVLKVQTPESLEEKILNNLLSSIKQDTLLLSDSIFKKVIVLSKPLQIGRDTLIIKTKGTIVLRADTAFTGPAIQLSPASKYISLNHLTLENFKTGIVAHNNVLEMNRVQFINCAQPVQNQFLFPDSSYVSGRLNRRAYQVDTIAKK